MNRYDIIYNEIDIPTRQIITLFSISLIITLIGFIFIDITLTTTFHQSIIFFSTLLMIFTLNILTHLSKLEDEFTTLKKHTQSFTKLKKLLIIWIGVVIMLCLSNALFALFNIIRLSSKFNSSICECTKLIEYGAYILDISSVLLIVLLILTMVKLFLEYYSLIILWMYNKDILRKQKYIE